jgi:hypothetical protein
VTWSCTSHTYVKFLLDFDRRLLRSLRQSIATNLLREQRDVHRKGEDVENEIPFIRSRRR